MPDLSHEIKLRHEGFRRIAGIDEAGRGPLAGPVTAGAVVLPDGYRHDILNDSKKATPKKRTRSSFMPSSLPMIACTGRLPVSRRTRLIAATFFARHGGR